MNKFNEFDLIKTPRNWIDEVTATNFEPTKRAKVIRIKYICNCFNCYDNRNFFIGNYLCIF